MKIYFLVATQPNNLGDLLINRLLIEEISKYGEVYVDSYGLPNNFREHLYINDKIIDVEKFYGGTLKRFPPFKILHKLRKDNFTHFFKSPGPTKISFNKNSIALLFIYSYLSILKIDVSFVGIDLLIKNKVLNFILDKSVNNILVRSKKNLEEYKFRTLIFNYIPDLALLYKPILPVVKSKKIAISFREITSNYSLFIASLDKLFSSLIIMGYTIEIFYQVIPDYLFNKRIYTDLKRDHVHFKEDLLWFNQLDFYADKSFVLSNRLHVLLLGAAYQAIPLGYLDSNDAKVNKIFNIFNSLDLMDLVYTIPEIIDFQFIVETYKDKCLRIKNNTDKSTSICKDLISSLLN